MERGDSKALILREDAKLLGVRQVNVGIATEGELTRFCF
jgi:hypothetical protein